LIGALANLDAVSWGTIDSIANQGLASSMYRVGDEKRVTLSSGEVVTLVILGFDHDDLTAGGKAKITFGMKNLMAATLPMNTSNTNVGGWDSSVMRTTTMPDLLSKLPADLQAIIKPVNKLTSAGNMDSTINTVSDSLFLMSEFELRGATTYSFSGEGTQYEYYQGGVNADFIKRLSDGAGSASAWWLRSPLSGLSTNFCIVGPSGIANYATASYSYDVSFCFCI
jgi:hypothetical protein